MTKKFLSIIFAIIMIVSAMPMAFAAESDVYTHDISKDTIIITPTGYSVGDGEETAFTGRYVITGSNDDEDCAVIIQDGTKDTVFDITFKDLTIEKSEIRYVSSVTVSNNGTVNLTLEGENKLYGGKECCGIALCDSVTLVITDNSTGSLEATGGYGAAGIGTEFGLETSANIIINGGTVTATGGDGGAGIGTGYNGKLDTIKITGGTVKAIAGADAEEAIGKGADGTVNCKFTNYEETAAATCTSEGTKTAKCDYGCGATDTITVAMKSHGDEDGDGKCDNGGEAMENTAPDNTTTDSDECDTCGKVHTNFIQDIICAFTRFFIKLFTFLGLW